MVWKIIGCWHRIILRSLFVIQTLENKISEKEQELQAEVIQRDQLIQDKMDVCDSL